ncbi:MAG: ABC transporter ATP-binding protein [Oscillospiraceae bacterium]|jgi:branched-chain amino acid transport system ATP-binding protein|nr:ABC transporter ATP-binding protein [Oscillospiraceae bacterium]
MLKMTDINAGYGDLQVLFNVSLHVDEGECVTLVGANGAGKTTLLRIISGLMHIKSGEMTWYGKNLLAMHASRRADLGIAHIPQGRGTLATLDVMDNLLMAGYCKRVRKRRMENIEKMFEMFPKLKERRKQIAGSLSGGEQQMLAIARALVMEPTLLVLDEPSLGLAPIVVEEVFETIGRIRDSGVSILLVEQNLSLALEAAHRGYVLETGVVAMEGKSEDLLSNENIKAAYMGI